jgi:hypothetical protein
LEGQGMNGRKRGVGEDGGNDVGGDMPFGGHGDVYRWLRANFAFVTNWMAKQKPSWETVAGKMAREGVVGAKGKPPTRRSVWKVWKRVLRDVAAERERELAEEAECVAKERELLTGVPAKKYPRDLPKHWAPDTVEPSPRGLLAEPAARSLVPVSGVGTPQVGVARDGQPESGVERIRRKFGEVSGRGPPRSLSEISRRMSRQEQD